MWKKNVQQHADGGTFVLQMPWVRMDRMQEGFGDFLFFSRVVVNVTPGVYLDIHMLHIFDQFLQIIAYLFIMIYLNIYPLVI